FIELAKLEAEQSTYSRVHVGAVISEHGDVFAQSFNGVSSRVSDCLSAGCTRCRTGGAHGIGYDNCVCIHAEQRAIATAAAAGRAVSGAAIYLTLRPCIQCLLLAYAAEIREIRYSQDWNYPDDREVSYQKLA